jgi:hypothetical protein
MSYCEESWVPGEYKDLSIAVAVIILVVTKLGVQVGLH